MNESYRIPLSDASLTLYDKMNLNDFLKRIQDALHPIGSVFISVVSTDPATLLGFGTWSQIAAGKMLIGIDSGDADFDTVEETGGAKTANLAHTHTINHTHLDGTDEYTLDASDPKYWTPGWSGNSGSGGSATQSIMNPYFVVYIWKRTA